MLQGGSAAKFQVHSCRFRKGRAGRDDLVLALVGRQQDGVSTSPHDPGEAPSPSGPQLPHQQGAPDSPLRSLGGLL